MLSCSTEDDSLNNDNKHIVNIDDSYQNFRLERGQFYEFDFSKLSEGKVVELDYLNSDYIITKTTDGIKIEINNPDNLDYLFTNYGIPFTVNDSVENIENARGLLPIILHICCVKVKIEVGEKDQFTWEFNCTCL